MFVCKFWFWGQGDYQDKKREDILWVDRKSVNNFKQDCIPVGCVPPRGGTCLVRGGYLPGPGGVPAWSRGVYLPGWGGTCLAPGGVPAWSGGVTCLVPGGCTYLVRGGGLPAWSRGVYLVRHSPPCGQNSWHTLLKILPCPKLRLRAVII